MLVEQEHDVLARDLKWSRTGQRRASPGSSSVRDGGPRCPCGSVRGRAFSLQNATQRPFQARKNGKRSHRQTSALERGARDPGPCRAVVHRVPLGTTKTMSLLCSARGPRRPSAWGPSVLPSACAGCGRLDASTTTPSTPGSLAHLSCRTHTGPLLVCAYANWAQETTRRCRWCRWLQWNAMNQTRCSTNCSLAQAAPCCYCCYCRCRCLLVGSQQGAAWTGTGRCWTAAAAAAASCWAAAGHRSWTTGKTGTRWASCTSCSTGYCV